MKIIGIYKITNPRGKIYIGQSVNCGKRKTTYKRGDCKQQTKIFCSLIKYGWDAHKFEIIRRCSREELNELEKYYIELHQSCSRRSGLNLREGGGSRGKMSKETRQKMSEVMIGRKRTEESKIKQSKTTTGVKKKPFTDEHRLHLSIAQKNKPPMSDETRKRMSASKKGRPSHRKGKKLSKEHALKIGLALKGIKRPPFSEEWKRKISLNHAGTKGKKYSDESKKRMSDAQKKRFSKQKLIAT